MSLSNSEFSNPNTPSTLRKQIHIQPEIWTDVFVVGAISSTTPRKPKTLSDQKTPDVSGPLDLVTFEIS
jgi:hypothetical protein